MEAIIPIIVGFILTGIVGNRLLHSWQHRSWVKQQFFMGEEREYIALRELWDEIVDLSSVRLTRMRRLCAIVRLGDIELVRTRLSDYDQALARWNERFNSFLVRLLRYTDHNNYLANSLEHEIQPLFVRSGRELELVTKDRLAGRTLTQASVENVTRHLDLLSHQLVIFNRDILVAVQGQKRKTYEGVRLQLSADTIAEFSTWELFKALFHSRIQPYEVVRAPFDFILPSHRR